MKKINLILCAAAVACAGFFVSCSNGATEITFVNQTTTKNLYSVTGTITETWANKTVTSGVAGTSDRTTTIVDTITKGYATITWTDYAKDDGNMGSKYTISFEDLKGTDDNTQVVTGTTTTTAFDTNPTEGSLWENSIELYKIDDAFFYMDKNYGQFVKASADNLESGDDFTLTLEYSEVRDNMPDDRLTTNTDVNTTTTTYKYELKFAAAK